MKASQQLSRQPANQRRPAVPAPARTHTPSSAALSGHPCIQARLHVSQPGDPLELEAEQVAKQVMRMPDPATAADTMGAGPMRALSLQRRCASCEDEALQRAVRGSQGDAPDAGLDAVVSTMRQPGRPLDAETRGFFEPRFGVDFSNVRIHTDSQAAASARSVNALAYTVGPNVVFREGAFAPRTRDGQHLLAHELTHVIQQSLGAEPAGLVQRQVTRECWSFVMNEPERSNARKGTAVHRAIREQLSDEFEQRGYGQSVNMSLPDGSFAAWRRGSYTIGPERAGVGYIDLAFHSPSQATLLLAEIKPANLDGVIDGETQLENYILKANNNDELKSRYSVSVFSPMVPRAFPLRPEIFSLGRVFQIIWCAPGLILYKEVHKQEENEEEEKKRPRKRPKKGTEDTKEAAARATIDPDNRDLLVFDRPVSLSEAREYVWGAGPVAENVIRADPSFVDTSGRCTQFQLDLSSNPTSLTLAMRHGLHPQRLAASQIRAKGASELPGWAPAQLRADFTAGRLRPGVYRDRYTLSVAYGFKANVVVWVNNTYLGTEVYAYQEFPDNPGFYEQFAARHGLTDWQMQLIRQTLTGYNADLWSLISQGDQSTGVPRLNPYLARDELRVIYANILKGVLSGSAAILASGAGIGSINSMARSSRLPRASAPRSAPQTHVPSEAAPSAWMSEGEVAGQAALPAWMTEAVMSDVEQIARSMGLH